MTQYEPGKNRGGQEMSKLAKLPAVPDSEKLIVFLDFDGVLNSEPFLRHQKNHQVGDLKLFDPTNVAALNKLCGSLVVKSIIVSSSWRTNRSLQQLKDLLSKEGFQYAQLVCGVTPSMGTRHRDISAWLDVNYDGTSRYLVIDDDSSLANSSLEVLKTDPHLGLRDSDVTQVIDEVFQRCK